MSFNKYTPECYRKPNIFQSKNIVDFEDRLGNKMKLTIVKYIDKKGNEKEQVIQVKHLWY